MKAIPTMYAGVQFRSRFEAELAQELDRVGVNWEYEPLSFLLPSGIHYWPDFYLPGLGFWIECRGYETPAGEQQLREFVQVMPAGHGFIVLRADGGLVLEAGASPERIASLTGGEAREFDSAFARTVGAITLMNQRRHPEHPDWKKMPDG